jgi:hypothetical protein
LVECPTQYQRRTRFEITSDSPPELAEVEVATAAASAADTGGGTTVAARAVTAADPVADRDEAHSGTDTDAASTTSAADAGTSTTSATRAADAVSVRCWSEPQHPRSQHPDEQRPQLVPNCSTQLSPP